MTRSRPSTWSGSHCKSILRIHFHYSVCCKCVQGGSSKVFEAVKKGEVKDENEKHELLDKIAAVQAAKNYREPTPPSAAELAKRAEAAAKAKARAEAKLLAQEEKRAKAKARAEALAVKRAQPWSGKPARRRKNTFPMRMNDHDNVYSFDTTESGDACLDRAAGETNFSSALIETSHATTVGKDDSETSSMDDAAKTTNERDAMATTDWNASSAAPVVARSYSGRHRKSVARWSDDPLSAINLVRISVSYLY